MTVDEAKRLRYRQTVYEIGEYNADGTTRRWRVSGAVKTWKRDPTRVRVPIKHGLYANGAIEEWNARYFTTKEPAPQEREKSKALKRK
ncbi:hypothetical protein LCGC14_0510330 [marine sediment metagenome]|uniref:Uncharacterized protein n=1 Tax=marine sediment metagenome TaxID=412755 RepID=A0A0F9SJW5_9ZZZZ